MKAKAVALLSGGLDSTLAVKMMLDQGVEVVALNFITPFCNCTAKSSSCKHEASRVAKEFGIPVRVVFKGMEYLRMVQAPVHGYGRGLNPCVDCRIFMHKAAKELMEAEGASFLITGEVLGQRPMSQRRATMEVIERESGTEGLILRPLSAHQFEPTVAENRGLVDRGKLLGITGRSRKEQIKLASELGVIDYPCPAGGCLLTERDFAGKLKDLFDHRPDYDLSDVRLLKIGRHFRLTPKVKAIVGKNEAENETLREKSLEGRTLLTCEEFPGPAALLDLSAGEEEELLAGSILLHYAKVAEGEVTVTGRGRSGKRRIAAPVDEARLEGLRVTWRG